jgi:hypothetical protein
MIPIPPIDIEETKINFNEQHYAIGGKMLIGKYELASNEFENFKVEPKLVDYIKEKLAYELAKKMIEDRLIEFTEYKNISTDSSTIAFRCYLAPDDQIKILRIYA